MNIRNGEWFASVEHIATILSVLTLTVSAAISTIMVIVL